MPGNGTFNLTALWRALGIKNPQTTLSERVQPVINVGDFSLLTPQHRPPTALFGGNVAAVAGEFSTIQVISRGPGGCVVPFFTAGNQDMKWHEGVVEGGLTPLVPQGQFSNEPIASIAETGTLLVRPGVALVSPGIATESPPWPTALSFLWIRPGRALVFWRDAAASGIVGFSLIVIDVPAAENLQ